jgi:hypothetical protein
MTSVKLVFYDCQILWNPLFCSVPTRERLLVSMIQDGIITSDEEQKLACLQEWAGLLDSDVAPYHQRMARVKRLAAYLQGNLPSVPTGTFLDGGETCHWKSPCTFE